QVASRAARRHDAGTIRLLPPVPARVVPSVRRFNASVCLRWQREPERRTLARPALGADAPAVALDDALDRGQTDTVSFVLVGTMQALERAEQLGRIGRLESGA